MKGKFMKKVKAMAAKYTDGSSAGSSQGAPATQGAPAYHHQYNAGGYSPNPPAPGGYYPPHGAQTPAGYYPLHAAAPPPAPTVASQAPSGYSPAPHISHGALTSPPPGAPAVSQAPAGYTPTPHSSHGALPPPPPGAPPVYPPYTPHPPHMGYPQYNSTQYGNQPPPPPGHPPQYGHPTVPSPYPPQVPTGNPPPAHVQAGGHSIQHSAPPPPQSTPSAPETNPLYANFDEMTQKILRDSEQQNAQHMQKVMQMFFNNSSEAQPSASTTSNPWSQYAQSMSKGNDSTLAIMRQSEEDSKKFQKEMNGYVEEANKALEEANKQVEEDLKSGKMSQAEYDALKLQMAQSDQQHQMNMIGIVNSGMQQRQNIVDGYCQDLRNDQAIMLGQKPYKNVNGVDYYYDNGMSKAASA